MAAEELPIEFTVPNKNLTTVKRHQEQNKTTEDRLPPHSTEAEQGVLGCILLEPSCLYQATEVIRDKAAFYDLRHQSIWEALIAAGKNGGIDHITVGEHLKKARKFTEVGGDAYLGRLPECTPSAQNLKTYLELLDEKWRKRKTLRLCSEITERAQNSSGSLEDFLYATRSDFNQIFGLHDRNSGKIFKPSLLAQYNTMKDPNLLLGNRWLCREGECVIVGPSGRGKSSLNMQMAICWALGRPFMGIAPQRPLRQVIFGAENDLGDLSEMFQGVLAGLGINPMEDIGLYEILEQNLTLIHCPYTGEPFLSYIQKWLEQNQVDLAWLDPLVSFADVDITKQEGAAKFLRQGLSRIASETGVCWMVIHHTPKASRDPKMRKAYGITSDNQYAGAGSYDISGWARAIMTLRETSDGVFCLILSKRGERSGATNPDGSSAHKKLWLRHAQDGIYWEQIDPPEEAADEGKRSTAGRPSQVQAVIALGLGIIVDTLTEPVSKNELAERILKYATSRRLEIGLTSCKKAVGQLFENGLLDKLEDGRFKKR